MNQEIKNNMKELNELFNKIKDKGYIKATKSGTRGIGNTFEDLIGKREDHEYNPDFNGIEIKTKNIYSKSYTTLFNLTPKGPHEYEVKRIKDTYGYPDKEFKDCKVLNVSFFGNKITLISNRYLFKLEVNRKEEKIYLLIYNRNFMLIEKEVYWDFKEIKERLEHKLKYLAMVGAWKTTRNKEAYYKYVYIKFYVLKDFSTFINLIEEGKIRVSFHLSIWRDGEFKKEIHDRGTSFQIMSQDLKYLFDEIKYW